MDDDDDIPSNRGLMLVSIKPHHVAQILTGTKTVELRRTKPDVRPGQPVAIYATAPVSSVVATCVVANVTTGNPGELADALLPDAAVTRNEYDAYFRGSDQAVGIHLVNVKPLCEHIALNEIRNRAHFTPPQTWHFIDRIRLGHLMGGHAAHDALAALTRKWTVLGCAAASGGAGEFDERRFRRLVPG